MKAIWNSIRKFVPNAVLKEWPVWVSFTSVTSCAVNTYMSGVQHTESKSFLCTNTIEQDTGWQRVCVVGYAHVSTLPPSVHLGPAQIRIAVWVQTLLLCKLEAAASGLQRPAIHSVMRQEHKKFKLSQRMCTWFNYYSTRAQYQEITSPISTFTENTEAIRTHVGAQTHWKYSRAHTSRRVRTGSRSADLRRWWWVQYTRWIPIEITELRIGGDLSEEFTASAGAERSLDA